MPAKQESRHTSKSTCGIMVKPIYESIHCTYEIVVQVFYPISSFCVANATTAHKHNGTYKTLSVVLYAMHHHLAAIKSTCK